MTFCIWTWNFVPKNVECAICFKDFVALSSTPIHEFWRFEKLSEDGHLDIYLFQASYCYFKILKHKLRSASCCLSVSLPFVLSYIHVLEMRSMAVFRQSCTLSLALLILSWRRFPVFIRDLHPIFIGSWNDTGWTLRSLVILFCINHSTDISKLVQSLRKLVCGFLVDWAEVTICWFIGLLAFLLSIKPTLLLALGWRAILCLTP